MKAEIFGKTDCIHCEKAKMLCSQKDIEFIYQELGKDFEMQFILEKFPGARTFPQITVDGKHVGGFDDLEVFLANQDKGVNYEETDYLCDDFFCCANGEC